MKNKIAPSIEEVKTEREGFEKLVDCALAQFMNATGLFIGRIEIKDYGNGDERVTPLLQRVSAFLGESSMASVCGCLFARRGACSNHRGIALCDCDCHMLNGSDASDRCEAEQKRKESAIHDWLDAAKRLMCSCCRAPFDVSDSGWRWSGQAWEHKCKNVDAQAGHFPAMERK